jgi:ATP-dependent protease ClpP protease subunit
MSDVIEFGKPKVHSNGYFPCKAVATAHEFYLTGDIGPAEDYIEWFDAIRHSSENDIIKIYINSFGGDLFTAIQFLRVLSDTPATVICSVEGACMSAATMIFLSASHYEVTPHSIFMFHNYSGGTIGKGGEMIDQLQHERKWSERLMKEVYKDFMAADEIKSMLDNRDIWMDGEEVVKRLESRIKKIEKPAPKSKAKPAVKSKAKPARKTNPIAK